MKIEPLAGAVILAVAIRSTEQYTQRSLAAGRLGGTFESEIGMAHKKRNGKLGWRSKRANHGIKPRGGKEKSRFCRAFRRSRKSAL